MPRDPYLHWRQVTAGNENAGSAAAATAGNLFRAAMDNLTHSLDGVRADEEAKARALALKQRLAASKKSRSGGGRRRIGGSSAIRPIPPSPTVVAQKKKGPDASQVNDDLGFILESAKTEAQTKGAPTSLGQLQMIKNLDADQMEPADNQASRDADIAALLEPTEVSEPKTPPIQSPIDYNMVTPPKITMNGSEQSTEDFQSLLWQNSTPLPSQTVDFSSGSTPLPAPINPLNGEDFAQGRENPIDREVNPLSAPYEKGRFDKENINIAFNNLNPDALHGLRTAIEAGDISAKDAFGSIQDGSDDKLSKSIMRAFGDTRKETEVGKYTFADGKIQRVGSGSKIASSSKSTLLPSYGVDMLRGVGESLKQIGLYDEMNEKILLSDGSKHASSIAKRYYNLSSSKKKEVANVIDKVNKTIIGSLTAKDAAGKMTQKDIIAAISLTNRINKLVGGKVKTTDIMSKLHSYSKELKSRDAKAKKLNGKNGIKTYTDAEMKARGFSPQEIESYRLTKKFAPSIDAATKEAQVGSTMMSSSKSIQSAFDLDDKSASKLYALSAGMTPLGKSVFYDILSGGDSGLLDEEIFGSNEINNQGKNLGPMVSDTLMWFTDPKVSTDSAKTFRAYVSAHPEVLNKYFSVAGSDPRIADSAAGNENLLNILLFGRHSSKKRRKRSK